MADKEEDKREREKREKKRESLESGSEGRKLKRARRDGIFHAFMLIKLYLPFFFQHGCEIGIIDNSFLYTAD